MGEINARAFLKYVGCEVMKPDSNLRQIMCRLSLVDSDISNPKTHKQIQEVGEAMAKAVGVRVIEVDYLFYIWGSGGVKCVQYQMCGIKPRCDECPLTKLCEYQGKNPK